MIDNYHIMHFGEGGQPNITGETFREWIDYCFSTCDYFSLTRTRSGTLWIGPRDSKLIEEEILREEQTGERSRYILQPAPHPQQALFLQKLQPWKVGTIRSNHWYGTRVPKDDRLIIDLFAANDRTKAVVLACYDDFLLERPYVIHPDYPEYPDLRVRDLPEDLCFFRGDALWMGSCSHEGFAHITALTTEDEAVMRRLGIYHPIPWAYDRRDFRMKLSDFKIEE